jgi:hypothetical protein
VVLPARSGWSGAGSLDVLQEQAWPVPAERPLSSRVRERLAPLHKERLVGGEGFAVDASLIKADANRQKGIEGDKGLPPEATGRAIDECRLSLLWSSDRSHSEFVSPSDPAARGTGANVG